MSRVYIFVAVIYSLLKLQDCFIHTYFEKTITASSNNRHFGTKGSVLYWGAMYNEEVELWTVLDSTIVYYLTRSSYHYNYLDYPLRHMLIKLYNAHHKG